ncbi:MAG: class I SAM-dependent methyltransferase [Clostridia bacterium]|nr:class I SAM-dependent methyltransferase [Clostridia bacterium]
MEKYYNNTENKPANKNVQYLINQIKPTPSTAIDIGCGAGRDTVFLIQNGWQVLAIDRNDVEDRIKNRLTEEEKHRFRFSKQQFENMELEQTNLIVSNFSLSFCNKDKFSKLWNKIQNSILPNRIFRW